MARTVHLWTRRAAIDESQPLTERNRDGGPEPPTTSTLNRLPPRANGRTGDRGRPPGPEQARRTPDSGGGRGFPPRLSWPWVLLLIFLVVNYFVAPIVVPDTSDRVTLPYTTFKSEVQRGNVSDIT